MTVYRGFSTQGLYQPRSYNLSGGTDGQQGNRSRQYRQTQGFTLTDAALVRQDFINALNIRQGEKPGRPEYGTTVWDFIFDPNTPDVQAQLTTEIRRVASLDSRIALGEIRAFPEENGILVELEIAYQPFNDTQTINMFFDRNTNSVLSS